MNLDEKKEIEALAQRLTDKLTALQCLHEEGADGHRLLQEFGRFMLKELTVASLKAVAHATP
jgi:hypothetical protein